MYLKILAIQKTANDLIGDRTEQQQLQDGEWLFAHPKERRMLKLNLRAVAPGSLKDKHRFIKGEHEFKNSSTKEVNVQGDKQVYVIMILWVAGNKIIVKNVDENIPVSLLWFLLPFLAFLCFPASAQFIDSSS